MESSVSRLTLQQLRWRCRRGVRELDVLFGRFLDETYATLSEDQQIAFERFLNEQDPRIMDWLFDKSAPNDDEFVELVNLLRDQSGLS